MPTVLAPAGLPGSPGRLVKPKNGGSLLLPIQLFLLPSLSLFFKPLLFPSSLSSPFPPSPPPHFPEEKGSIAAVCFNVKGPDLCYLDQPGKIEKSDEALYEKLGVEPKPFESVEYFAPYTAKGLALNTFRNNEALLDNVTPLTWGLREVLQFAEVLLNKDDVDAKADALIDFITMNVVDKEFSDPMLQKEAHGAVVRGPRRVVPRRAAGHGEERTARAGAPTTSPRSAKSGTACRTSPPAAPDW